MAVTFSHPIFFISILFFWLSVSTITGGAGNGGLFVNLFGFLGAEISAASKKEDCQSSFDNFFAENFAPVQPQPERSYQTLPGNESEAKQWKRFFNSGEPGSEGYGACFKPDPKDPSQ